MKHVTEAKGTYLTVRLDGKIYAHDAGVLREDILGKLEKDIAEISMDLAGLTYIDSTGLGVIISIHKRIKEKGGKMVLTGVQGLPAELFKRTRLDRVLNIQFVE